MNLQGENKRGVRVKTLLARDLMLRLMVLSPKSTILSLALTYKDALKITKKSDKISNQQTLLAIMTTFAP